MVQTLHDADAENEAFTFTVTVDGDGGLMDAIGGVTSLITWSRPTGTIGADHPLVIDDDETQTYKLTLAAPVAPAMPTEEQPVTVNLTADPFMSTVTPGH